jgi:polyisoprenyl-phosphate glycosyltransferase
MTRYEWQRSTSVTLFETQTPGEPEGTKSGTPRSDVVIRVPAPPTRTGTFLSVVVVADRNAADVEADLITLEAVVAEAYPVHEIVLVLPGSRGRLTWARELAQRQPNLQVIGLVRGVRDEVAFTAGLDGALGDVVVTARLGVDPPEAIVRCAGLISEETPVIVGVETSAAAGRRVALRLSRAFASRSMGQEIATVSLGLRAYSRPALDAWLPRRDRDRVLRLLPSISGYPSAVMRYETGPRTDPRPASSFRQVLRSIFYASGRPLRLAVGIALLASLANLIYALYVVVVGLIRGTAVAGWTSMSLQMSVMFFLLSVVIAIMAEFMFQSNETANELPIYRIAFEATSSVLSARDMLNVDAETHEKPADRDHARTAQ